MDEIDGYLMDTNHVVPLLCQQDKSGPMILARIASVGADSPIYIATATLAELEVGCCLFEDKSRSDAQEEIHQTIEANKIQILEFTRHTARYYGELKSSLAQKFNRNQSGKWKMKWPEGWDGPVSGRSLDVDEFDLIMVSHSIERRLVLLTDDSMNRIRDGLSHLPDMRFANWRR